jgi:alpha-D-ribose 1-methylphosphonate 5-triphosphate diphosphatase
MIAVRAGRTATASGERQGVWVVIDGDTIVDVTKHAPARAERVDASGLDALPGLIDLHADCLERHRRPRAQVDMGLEAALHYHDAEAAAHGITTNFVCAAFEDATASRRSSAEAYRLVETVAAMRDTLRVDHRVHARIELTTAELAISRAAVESPVVDLVSYMDHAPGHGQYADIDTWRESYRTEYGADGGALTRLYAARERGRAALPDLRRQVAAMAGVADVPLASHDDDSPESVAEATHLGVSIAEFPVTVEAAASASAAGLCVVMGAPNARRGRSHVEGNLSARNALEEGWLGALVSDYHPPSMLHAIYQLEAERLCSWSEAVGLVSDAPARAAGLLDRGRIAPGMRADLVLVDKVHRQPVVRQTWVGGVPSWGIPSAAARPNAFNGGSPARR